MARYVDEQGRPAIPSSWPRVQAPGQPRGVTIAATPIFGLMWYFRGPSYWAKRVGWALLMALPASGYLLIYTVILLSDHARNGYSTAFWVTGAILLALTTAAAVAVITVGDRLPGTRLSTSDSALARTAGQLSRLICFVVLYLMTPGSYLVVLVDGLRPLPERERAARADLELQLAELRAAGNAHGHGGGQQHGRKRAGHR
jgi:hypothetical protein